MYPSFHATGNDALAATRSTVSVHRVSDADRRGVDWSAVADLERERRVEEWPESAAPDRAALRERLRDELPSGARLWLAYDAHARLVATARLMPGTRRDRIAMAAVHVSTAARRRGIGRHLLGEAAREARANGCEYIETVTSSHTAAGERLVARVSGRATRHRTIGCLSVDEINHAVLGAWRALTPAPLVIHTFAGPYPEEWIRPIARLKQYVRSAYGTRSTDIEQHVAALRSLDARLGARGIERSTTVALAAPGGVVGYYEALWDRHEPSVLQCTEIAVDEAWRGQGIGQLLTAVSLPFLLRSRASIRWARSVTDQLTTRTMSRIDRGAGFRAHHVDTWWVLPVGGVLEYCRSGGFR